MSPEEFQQFFAVLQKSGETARSVIYIFVLIYGAMLYYGANTYVYPMSQHQLNVVQHQINQDLVTQTDTCDKAPAGTPCLPPSEAKTIVSKFNTDFSAHVLDYWQDKASSDREFQVPFVGIAPDRNWFWLINIILGPLFYVLIRGSFENHLSLLDYLFHENHDSATRIMLLNTTQIITSASSSRTPGTSRAGLHWSAEFTLIVALLLLPILVSGCILFDWIYLACTADKITDVISQPSLTLGCVFTLLALVWQMVRFCGIYQVVDRLFQSDRERRIVAADAVAGQPR
jgi:hypothetical protein